MDVASAEVLAMAVVPTYNPNGAAQEKAQTRRNRIVTDLYEPGSTLKPLVVGAALDARAVQPNSVLFCENGRFKVGKHTINDTSPHGSLTLTEVVAKSSNIGMAKIGQAMGKVELEQALRRFGMGRKSGVEFPGEVMGLLRPAATWSELETATIAFGQGMAVNGLQLAAAYRVLAADGAYRPPRLVRAMERPAGGLQPVADSLETPVLSLETARRVTAMLEAASGPAGGTGRLAAVPGYRVAGKTGTAQKADPVTGGYSRDRYVALFAGYLPADAPQVVITVAVDEPTTNHYGGVVAAPVFAAIGAATMQRLGVAATGPAEAEVSAAALQPAKTSRPHVAPAVTPQPGPTRATAPMAATAVPDVVVPGVMPSFVGLTARQAIERFVAAQLHGELNMQGTGTVVRQLPEPGARLADDATARLVLAP
jgi:cell division protein FtsI (penicillin-binding protein 3)